MTQPLAVRDRVGELLLKGPATSRELAGALTLPESVVLIALDEMRHERLVQFAGGDWFLTSTTEEGK